ncbi:MAG: dihydrofolate reductase [Pyrinomonadaceae bacterium]
MLIGIVAIAKNLAIGKGGKLPWHYSADLKFFKETTSGHAIVMGSKTWHSIGRPLPDRISIVLSGQNHLDLPHSVRQLSSKDEVIEYARTAGADIFIIGGAKVFKTFADNIDRWIVTEVPTTADDADAFMPPDFLNGFGLENERELGDGLRVKFYKRLVQN